MPLRLKSLELHGYKTFASRTNFLFPGMITAIVGPNGSGKSNITDGLRWVLGEQSYGLLRGKKTEDMIFAGSEGRPRAGMAQATIHFDNTEGWLPIDYTEVAITRRAYRDGQNEYLLNGQKVRLRDIGELLSQSGLSERNFTVIGQGLVDASLALRPEERRKLFEEAAGIGLYRSRREESLHRLENTHRNIERVQDILAELEPRIAQLERQAKKALEYERVKADLKLYLREWYGYHWFKSQQDITYQRDNARQQEKNVEAARVKHASMVGEVGNLRSKIQELRYKLNQWHMQASQLHNQVEVVSRDIAVNEERQRSLADQLNNLQIETTRLRQEISSTKASAETLEDEKQSIDAELSTSQSSYQEQKNKLDELLRIKTQKEADLAALKGRLSKLETSIVQLQAVSTEKLNRKKTINSLVEKLKSETNEAASQLAVFQQELKKAANEKESTEEKLVEIMDQVAFHRKEQTQAAAKLSELRTKKAKLQGELSRLKIEMDVIRQAEKNLAGYSNGAKQLLTLIRKGDISGMSNALSGDVVIPEKYEAAITSALGEYLDAVILTRDGDLELALNALEEASNGRSTLLPAKPHHEAEKLSAPVMEGAIGNALDLVKFPAEIRPFMNLVLGRTLVINSRKNAKAILATLPEDAKVVTLIGEVFFKNGVVIGGKQSSNTRVSRPRQLQDLESQTEVVEDEIGQLDEQIAQADEHQRDSGINLAKFNQQADELQTSMRKATAQYQQVNLQEEKIRRQVDWHTSQETQYLTEFTQLEEAILSTEKLLTEHKDSQIELHKEIETLESAMQFEDIDTIRSEVNYQQTTTAVNQRAVNELDKRLKEKQEFITKSELNLTALEQRINDAQLSQSTLETARKEKKLQEDDKNKEIQILQQDITPAEADLDKLEEQFTQLQEMESSSQQTLANAEKYLTQAQMDLAHKKEGIEILRKRIEEDFGLVAFEYGEDLTGPNPLPIDGMVEELPHVEVLAPEMEENLNRQKAMLRRMGSVNPEAQAEYAATLERYTFLKAQINDLFKAEEDLKKILGDLDELMRSEFHQTFQKVAEEFPKMFNRLFGGGSARLVMTDPENIHETGIEINARLPGRREQELTLLSGGERSLTAVALVFALLKISPTPFCVLDEVDAALDETNVGRFRDLLEELSRDIQFILVTHNRNTIQAANVIYGVTMGRDSSSQMISLRLDEVPEDMLKGSK